MGLFSSRSSSSTSISTTTTTQGIDLAGASGNVSLQAGSNAKISGVEIQSFFAPLNLNIGDKAVAETARSNRAVTGSKTLAGNFGLTDTTAKYIFIAVVISIFISAFFRKGAL